MDDRSSTLRRGGWLREGASHSSQFGAYRAPRSFDPAGAFAGNNPLAAWCELYPDGAHLEATNDVYQFGVYTGGSMAGQARYFELLGIRFGTLFGFDSFEGLPDLSANEVAEVGHIADWRAGGFSAADALGVHDYPALVRRIEAIVNRPGGAPVQFVRGFFNASLTPTLARERGMRPALYADVDGDLYSSGLQCLDWLFCSGLIQAGRTVIRYDDWLEPGRNGALMGEQRAHREITMRHQVVWEHTALSGNWFRVRSYQLNVEGCAALGYPRVRSVLQNAEVSGDSEHVPAALPTVIAKSESPDYAIGYTAGYLDGAADLIASWSRMRHTVGPPLLLTTPTPDEAHAASVHGRSGQRSDGARVVQPSLEAVAACHKRVQLWERTSKVGTLYACERQRELDRWQSWALATNWSAVQDEWSRFGSRRTESEESHGVAAVASGLPRVCQLLLDEAESACRETGRPPLWPWGNATAMRVDPYGPGFSIFGPGNLPSPSRYGWRLNSTYTGLSKRGLFRLHCPMSGWQAHRRAGSERT